MEHDSRIAELAAEGFGFEVRTASELSGGRINRTLKVETNEGPRVLRLYPKTRRRSQIEFEVSLHDAIARGGGTVPQVFRSSSGAALGAVEGHPFVWLEYFDGCAISDDEATRVSPTELAALLAPIRRGLSQVEAPFRPVAETRVFASRASALISALSEEAERGSLHPGVHEEEAAIRELFGQMEKWEKSLELPTGIVHGDIHPKNVLHGGGKLCLIDFDGAHVGWRMQDVVLPALEFSFDERGELDEARYSELVEALGGDVLTPAERHALTKMRLLLTLKFAATCAALGCPLNENRYLRLLFA